MPIPVPTTDHNEAIVGDELHNISLNHQWRAIVGGQMSRLLHRQFWDGTEAEIDTTLNRLHELIHDLYTTEPQSMVLATQQALRLSAQAIPALNDTPIIWTSGDYDVSNPTRLVAPNTGLWQITAQINTSSAGLSNMRLSIRINNANFLSGQLVQQTTGHYAAVAAQQIVAPGDYVEVFVISNAAVTAIISNGFLPRINATLLQLP